MNLISRKKEIAILEQMYASSQPEFLALYGRRRVGKTFLIRQFFEDKKAIFFNVTGAKNGTLVEQIFHFTDQVSKIFYHGVALVAPKNWNSVLKLLTEAIGKKTPSKKIVFATSKSGIFTPHFAIH